MAQARFDRAQAEADAINAAAAAGTSTAALPGRLLPEEEESEEEEYPDEEPEGLEYPARRWPFGALQGEPIEMFAGSATGEGPDYVASSDYGGEMDYYGAELYEEDLQEIQIDPLLNQLAEGLVGSDSGNRMGTQRDLLTRQFTISAVPNVAEASDDPDEEPQWDLAESIGQAWEARIRSLLQQWAIGMMASAPAEQWLDKVDALIASFPADHSFDVQTAQELREWISREQSRAMSTNSIVQALSETEPPRYESRTEAIMFGCIKDPDNRDSLAAVLDVVRNTSVRRLFNIGTCYKWAEKARDAIVALGEKYYDNDEYTITYVDWQFKRWKPSDLLHGRLPTTSGHGGLRIEFKKSGLVAYFDNGAGGGIYHNKPEWWGDIPDLGMKPLVARRRLPREER